MNTIPVTATISTKDRYFTTLPLAITAIANQTMPPAQLLIYDDGEQKDLRTEPLYQHLFGLLQAKGIEWIMQFGARQGQIRNHQRALKEAKYDLILRLDDDNIPEPDVLEKLYIPMTMDTKLGAIGGIIPDPNHFGMVSPLASSKIEDIFLGLNVQWFKHPTGNHIPVDSLYSSFLFRKEAGSHGYCMDLSQAAHREETIFTYEMKRKGWKLLVAPSAITWHFRYSQGGIRSITQNNAWAHDDMVFGKKIKEWGVEIKDWKLVVLDNGMGDHYAFKHILPELKEKNKDKKVALLVCYPEVFMDTPEFKLGSIADLFYMGVNPDDFNIYKWMVDHNWKESIVEAYRRMYL